MLAILPHHLQVFSHLLSLRHSGAISNAYARPLHWGERIASFVLAAGNLAAPKTDIKAPPILVADFESAAADWCLRTLSALGSEILFARNVAAVSGLLHQRSPWLLIFVSRLEDGEFAAFLAGIRAYHGHIPIAVIGPSPQHEAGTLREGADEYLLQSHGPELVCARLTALRRRSRRPVMAEAPLRLDCDGRRAWALAAELHLPPALFALLTEFLANPGRVLSPERLAAAISPQGNLQRDTVKAHVHKLRQVLAPHGLQASIHTLHRVGYRYDPPAPTADVTATSPLPHGDVSATAR